VPTDGAIRFINNADGERVPVFATTEALELLASAAEEEA
jgi:hypothetical protein